MFKHNFLGRLFILAEIQSEFQLLELEKSQCKNTLFGGWFLNVHYAEMFSVKIFTNNLNLSW